MQNLSLNNQHVQIKNELISKVTRLQIGQSNVKVAVFFEKSFSRSFVLSSFTWLFSVSCVTVRVHASHSNQLCKLREKKLLVCILEKEKKEHTKINK